MAIITTKNYSNPAPVRGIDYAGQPIPDNGHYNGRPEHMGNVPQDAPRTSVKPVPTRRKRRGGFMSPEMREKARERMRRYWDRKRSTPSVDNSVTPLQGVDAPSVDT